MRTYVFILVLIFIIPYSNKAFSGICLSVEECLPLAEQGNVYDQLAVAGYYHTGGKGTSQNYKEAFKWYLKAAKQGNVDAQFSVATFLDNGDGVSKDSIKAFTWYYLAAEQGDADAQSAIADYYYEGEEIPKNLIKAYAWFYVSSENGNSYAKDILPEIKEQIIKLDKLEEAELLSKIYFSIYTNQ